jgi:lipoprotein NlpD
VAPSASNPSGKPENYTVKAGDTLYAIALDNGQDYRDIAKWNSIENPNIIRVGQVLRVQPPAGSPPPDTGVVVTPVGAAGTTAGTATGAAGTPVGAPTLKEPKVAKRLYSDAELAKAQAEGKVAPAVAAVTSPTPTPAPATAPASAPVADGAVTWAWPVAAPRVVGGFSGSNKGLDLAAKVGDAVLAAAPGKVIYAGTGLRGYGQLIIIRHNTTYLSAYAHNSRLTVRQDQVVKQGEKIAEAGQTDTDSPKLHFEIRQQGTPVDPAKFLPAK